MYAAHLALKLLSQGAVALLPLLSFFFATYSSYTWKSVSCIMQLAGTELNPQTCFSLSSCSLCCWLFDGGHLW